MSNKNELSEGLTLLGDNKASFKGLEVFVCPDNVTEVEYESDEVTAMCPVTGQPDWYTVKIRLIDPEFCIESKSLKLYLQSFRSHGEFCEAFCNRIADDIAKAVRGVASVDVVQKPRGGVKISAHACSYSSNI